MGKGKEVDDLNGSNLTILKEKMKDLLYVKYLASIGRPDPTRYAALLSLTR